jgi:glycosyltransferase involved in cell wall biosynthesis
MNLLEIWTEELPKGWEWNPRDYLGGSPEFVVNTAECALEDSDVIVYYDGVSCCHNGVYYVGRRDFMGSDVVLACNSKPPKMGKHNIYWTNWFHQRQENCLEFDERIVLSPFHAKIFGDNSRIVPHSCWSNEFTDPVKEKGLCLYSSSPDRGGEFLKKIWSNVEIETGARLISTYDKKISNEEMIDLYKRSQFWLHPCQGVELFCIAAVKAQVAGCVPIVVPNMALETTVKYGIKVDLEEYETALIKAIKNPPDVEEVDFGSWETVTKDLLMNAKRENNG